MSKASKARAARAEAEATARERRLDARHAAEPRPYTPALGAITCMCGTVHVSSPDLISCGCGRRWQRSA